MTSDSLIKVRYVETDQMGIVHHSNYYHWFEVGRGDFLKQAGANYEEIEKEGVMVPLIETHCIYKSPAKYDDDLIIRTKIESLIPTRVEFSYKVIRTADEKVLAEGETSHVFTNKTFKPVNLIKENNKIYNLLKSSIE
jgi:acyl-CoA thioester hydrolase